MTRASRGLTLAAIAASLLMSSTGDAQSISSEEEALRVTRAWALLRRTFETGTRIEQANVVFAVASLESAEALTWLEQVARSNSPMRGVAVGELARSGRPEFLPLLREALADRDRDVRRAAVQYLGRTPEAAVLLKDVLISGDPELADFAANRARWQEGSVAASLLLETLAGGHATARSAAARELFNALRVGGNAAEMLQALRRRQAENVLARTLQDNAPDVRALGALLLARLGNPAGTSELTAIVTNGTSPFTYRAAAALTSLGVLGYEKFLIDALAAPDENISSQAAAGLDAFPGAASTAVFQRALTMPVSAGVRYRAFDHVTGTPTTGDVAPLQRALADIDPTMRLLAAQRLLARGRDARSLDVLEAIILDSVNKGVSPGIALGLFAEHAEPARARSLLRALLPLSAAEVSPRQQDLNFVGDVMSIIVNLERLSDHDAVPAIAALLGPEQNVTQRVVHALVSLAGRDAGETLTAAMDAAPHLIARIHAAAGVISLYGTQSPN